MYSYFYTNPLRRAQAISEYPELTLGDLNWALMLDRAD
jgi:hypothetical protein